MVVITMIIPAGIMTKAMVTIKVVTIMRRLMVMMSKTKSNGDDNEEGDGSFSMFSMFSMLSKFTSCFPIRDCRIVEPFPDTNKQNQRQIQNTIQRHKEGRFSAFVPGCHHSLWI